MIVNIIVFTAGLGIACGFNLPGANPDLLTEFELKPYFDIYFIYIIPNMIFTGAIVFGIVTFTRNISAGFIFVIIILILQGFLVSFGQEPDNRLVSALLDPFGDMAFDYYTRYWTVAEQNELYIPIKEIVVYNRLIWMSSAFFVFISIYKLFSFS